MISTTGRRTLERFVGTVKTMLMQNITAMLQRDYGIWSEGRVDSVQRLTTKDPDIIYRAKLLRQRLHHIENSLPQGMANSTQTAIRQLTAEQAFTILNRFCALRMCEERELILQSVGKGYESEGFTVYDMVTGGSAVASTYKRYTWYLQSLFDELSVELPAVFDRYSPYGLIEPDEQMLTSLFDLINDENLTQFYDEQTGVVVNFWKENETLGWIFQYYNSIDERRLMRDQSNRPRNSREMAVRNQFFTPDYVVRFLTDNTLGRIWYEMTAGNTSITDVCQYMVLRPNEELQPRELKDPLELAMLDPACGSMHFGLFTYDVMQAIYMDAWDNHPELWQETLRYEYATREEFMKQVPKLILENNIHGVEIDPRALQIAALSLWLRAQQSWSEQGVDRTERPVIERSHLVLAESMPGNKRMLRLLTEEMEAPLRRLVEKVWEKMKYVGEAGLLIKMEQEISAEIDELRKNWTRISAKREQELNTLFSTDEERKQWEKEQKMYREESKQNFFLKVKENLQDALLTLSSKLSEAEGYENTLFANDAVRGFAFIELCHKRYDVILMNPPFGEGSENTIDYLDTNYPAWCNNLVCAFFDRMQDLLLAQGLVGCIFDRTVLIKTSYEDFRKKNICGYIRNCADTGWGVLDADVKTSTLVLNKTPFSGFGWFLDIQDVNPSDKAEILFNIIKSRDDAPIKLCKSAEFAKLPNSVIGYYFDKNIIKLFQNTTIIERGLETKKGHDLSAKVYPRLFFEIVDTKSFSLMYNGGAFNMFYMPYYDATKWNENTIRADKLCNLRSLHLQQLGTVGFGKRGEILDAHVLKKGFIFTREGIGMPNVSKANGFAALGYLNSNLSQFSINLYCEQHKGNGYVNILPMPDYAQRQKDIERIVQEIIDIKRWWFSLDETNLEYRGLLAQINVKESIADALVCLQDKLTADYARYQELVKKNDDLWMDLADIESDSEFRTTLNDYKSRRPYEELISIDGGSSENIINQQTFAKEIVMELVGMAFGRWTMSSVAFGTVPEFNGIFDALPFMPKVALNTSELLEYYIPLPMNGLLFGGAKHNNSIVKRVQLVMQKLWNNKADDIEYELCQMIGCESLEDYFANMGAGGFFDYHFKRYTKSRRKAPIYWPISSQSGDTVVWCYYPRLSEQTIPAVLLMLSSERNTLQGELNGAMGTGDRKLENKLRTAISEIESLEIELTRVNNLPYKPSHDDGVPVTAAPLLNCFRHVAWKNECADNWNKLESGEYDWSHLSYSIYPERIRTKVKKDWCLALTHGLEELCDNKPKEKKTRKKKTTQIEAQFDFGED